MKNVIDIKESSNNSISINDSETNDIICFTVPSEELYSMDIENVCAFKVDSDGKIILNLEINENNIKKVTNSIKEVIAKEELLTEISELSDESLLEMFEQLPEDLSENDISEIVEFVKDKTLKKIGCSRILPYSVKLTDSGDIKITLIIYNGDKLILNLPQIPMKLTDANKSIIMAELVDINALVNCGRIRIVETIVSKEKLKENFINSQQWDITFNM